MTSPHQEQKLSLIQASQKLSGGIHTSKEMTSVLARVLAGKINVELPPKVLASVISALNEIGIQAPGEHPVVVTILPKFKKRPATKRDLTTREKEILAQAADGHTSKEIASALGVAYGAIENKRQRLLRNLGIDRLALLTKFAISHGLIDGSITTPVERLTSLSCRERETLTLISNGLSNKEIASQFGVSVRTIETYRDRLLTKLKFEGNLQVVPMLTKYAIKCGLTTLDLPVN